MLSALTGLLFHLSTLFRLDAYFGALFPLPIVIAAANGPKAASRVAVVTSMLLFLISGPLRAVNYYCLHGAMAYSAGMGVDQAVLVVGVHTAERDRSINRHLLLADVHESGAQGERDAADGDADDGSAGPDRG